MNNKADEHYHKTLLKNCGLLPWKKLIQTRDAMIKNAEIFHKRKIQIKCFREWLVYTRSEYRRRSELADSLYKSLLLRRGWQSWKKVQFLVDVFQKEAHYSALHILGTIITFVPFSIAII